MGSRCPVTSGSEATCSWQGGSRGHGRACLSFTLRLQWALPLADPREARLEGRPGDSLPAGRRRAALHLEGQTGTRENRKGCSGSLSTLRCQPDKHVSSLAESPSPLRFEGQVGTLLSVAWPRPDAPEAPQAAQGSSGCRHQLLEGRQGLSFTTPPPLGRSWGLGWSSCGFPSLSIPSYHEHKGIQPAPSPATASKMAFFPALTCSAFVRLLQ